MNAIKITALLLAFSAHGVTLELSAGGETCTAEFAPGSVVEAYDDRWSVQVVALPECGEVVIEPPDDGPCAVLPDPLQRDTRIEYTIGNDFTPRFAETYEDIFGPWPLAAEAQSRTYRVEVSSAAYISFPFTVPASGGPQDRVIFTWEEGLAPSEGTTVSVSTCIGGVVESQALSGCWVQGQRSGGGLSIGVSPASAQCVVERGKSYYLNVADFPDKCDRARCEWLVRPLAVGAVE